MSSWNMPKKMSFGFGEKKQVSKKNSFKNDENFIPDVKRKVETIFGMTVKSTIVFLILIFFSDYLESLQNKDIKANDNNRDDLKAQFHTPLFSDKKRDDSPNFTKPSSSNNVRSYEKKMLIKKQKMKMITQHV